MNARILCLVWIVAAIRAPAAHAQQQNSAHAPLVMPRIGAPAPSFEAVDINDSDVNLAGLRGRWVVLEWFNHDCPYTRKHYNSGNMQALQREYTARGVAWISIVSSAPSKEGFVTVAQARNLTAEKGATPTWVVRDTAGTIGRAYGARNTPQLFVIDPEGTLRYGGAIDDKPSTRLEDVPVATNYLRAALEAGLSRRPIAITLTQPYGCVVQY
jgi:peroxiredoxin